MPTEPLNRRCKFEARGLRRVSLLWSWPPFFVLLSTLEEEAQKQIGAAKTFSGKRMPSRSLDEEVLLGCELFVRKTTWNHPRNLGTNILNPRSYSSNSHFQSAGASKETQQERLVASALFLMFNPFIRDPIVSHAIVSLSILFLAYFALAVTFLFHTPINPPLPMITVVSAIFSPTLNVQICTIPSGCALPLHC